MKGGSIKRENGYVVIRVPVAEAHSLRVALQECPCKSNKSASTKTIRQRLRVGPARAAAGRV